MHARIIHAVDDVPATGWNACVGDDVPYFRHEFLNALEQTGCVCKDTGWDPRHVVLFESDTSDDILGVVPAYLKFHSYGEYVFDWAWANAYHRYGYEYYPKLLIAAPFTPVTGPRMLIRAGADQTLVRQKLVDSIKQCAHENDAS
ncbi:MAG: GNAT family N-acetyltransferase, partial [Gammaproteobacteria bacterium]|nr:GNAT family N-acetyltransferase [Gammaproteobacteria bacterium]